MSTPQNSHHPCLCPCSESQRPPTSTGEPAIPAGRSDSGSHEAAAFPGSGAHETLCVPSKRAVCFPQP